MFISNQQECVFNRCGWYEDSVIFAENRLFAERVNELIRNETPLEQWVEILYESRNADLPFVEFNYGNLSYLDGDTPQLITEDSDGIEFAESYLWEDGELTDEESEIYLKKL